MIRLIMVLTGFLLMTACGSKPKNISVPDSMNVITFNGKYGYVGVINGSNVNIDPKFDFASNFKEGLAVVEENNLQGYIDIAGEYVIKPQFRKAYQFSEGMARVVMEKKTGFINRDGILVISYQFDDATDFKNQKALVKVGNRRYWIDTAGVELKEKQDSVFQKKILNY